MTFVFVAFLLFFVVSKPVESAVLVRTIAQAVGKGFTAAASSLSTFVQTLF